MARPVGDLVEGCAGNPCVNVLPKFAFRILLTYSAYCMTPCFPSWLGNGTSWCGFPVIDFIEGGVPGWPATRPGFCVAGSAPLEDEEEMKAALAARKGWRAAVGLAVVIVQYAHFLGVVATVDIPRSAIVVACLVGANMVAYVVVRERRVESRGWYIVSRFAGGGGRVLTSRFASDSSDADWLGTKHAVSERSPPTFTLRSGIHRNLT